MKCQIHKDTELNLDLEAGYHRDYQCPKCEKVIADALKVEEKRLAKESRAAKKAFLSTGPIHDGSLSLDCGKTTHNRADGKAPSEPYP